MWYVWLIFAGICFVAEMMTTGFLIFWLGLGAVLAMITSFITSSILVQTIVFVVTSTILILLTKPLVNKYIDKQDKKINTNTDAIIGKKGIVTSTINSLEGKGLVKVNGEVWSAKTNLETIPEGTEVEIIGIDGVKLMVTPLDIKLNILK